MREYVYPGFGGWAGADGALGYDPVGVVCAEGGGAVGERRGAGVGGPEFGFPVSAGADDGVSGQRVCGLAAGGFWRRGCQPGQRDGGGLVGGLGFRYGSGEVAGRRWGRRDLGRRRSRRRARARRVLGCHGIGVGRSGDDGPVRVGGRPAPDLKILTIVPADRVADRCPLGGGVPAHPDLRFLAVARYQVGHGVLGGRGRLALRGRCSLVGKHHEQRDDRGDDGGRRLGAGSVCQHVSVLLRPLGPFLKSPGAVLRGRGMVYS